MASEAIQNAVWQFNEAVSMLREARRYVAPHLPSLADEIDEGLPAMQAALEAIAAEASR